MRLIDADALTDRMYHDAFETDTDMQKWDSGCWIRYKMFENAIEHAPTIEPTRNVETVYRGECYVNWVRPKGEWLWRHGGECSECGFRNNNFDFNYCPNCGAKMKGE